MNAKRTLGHGSEPFHVSHHGRFPHSVALSVHSPSAEVNASAAYREQGYLAVLQSEFSGFLFQAFDNSWGILLVAQNHGIVHVSCQAGHLQIAQDVPVHVREVEVSVVLACHRSYGYSLLRFGQVGIDARLHELYGSFALVLSPYLLLQFLLLDGRVEMMEVGLYTIIKFWVSVEVSPYLLVGFQRSPAFYRPERSVHEQMLDVECRDERLVHDACLYVHHVYFSPLAFCKEHEGTSLVWLPCSCLQLGLQLTQVSVKVESVVYHVGSVAFSVACAYLLPGFEQGIEAYDVFIPYNGSFHVPLLVFSLTPLFQFSSKFGFWSLPSLTGGFRAMRTNASIRY